MQEIHLAITNAYILWKSNPANQQMKLKEFCIILAKELIGTHCSRKRIGQPPISVPSPVQLCDDHFPTKATRQLCFNCHQHNHERHTTPWYYCTCWLHLCHTDEKEVTDSGSTTTKQLANFFSTGPAKKVQYN